MFEAYVAFGDVHGAPLKHNVKSKLPEIQNYDGRLDDKQERELLELHGETRECFSQTPGRCNVGVHKIVVQPHAKLDHQRVYKVPLELREEVNHQVDQLPQIGCIFPRESKCAHLIVSVAKKDGSLRLCVDYRKLNTVTEPDQFPMADVKELLYQMAQASFITTLDLTRGYWQIAIHPDSQQYTAFATPHRLYPWNVMPYGLRNTVATFQSIMNEVLRDHKDYAVAYIDDVAVFLKTWDEQHLSEVLATTVHTGLKVKTWKCKSGQGNVKYLAHIVGSGKHAPDPDRVSAIRTLRLPHTKTELRKLLGLVNYYRDYISQYADRVAPLTDFTRKKFGNTTVWNDLAR